MLAIKKTTKFYKKKSKTVAAIENSSHSEPKEDEAHSQKTTENPAVLQITSESIAIIERMAGNLAHEVRSPLAVIKLAIENTGYIIDTLPGDSAISLKKQLKMIKDSADNIINIIDMHMANLRYAVLPDAQPNQTRKLRIKDIINEAIDEYSLTDVQRKLIYWNPPLNDDFFVIGNANHCKHVIFNLLKNALTAIKNAGKGRIHISTRKLPKQCGLIIKDTALGMSEEKVRNLFLRQVPVRGNGLGLGLQFCKQVMSNMGGNISCKSQPKRFTEFVLTFPKVD